MWGKVDQQNLITHFKQDCQSVVGWQSNLVLSSKSSSLVLALRRNTLSSWATIGINQVFIYAQLH
jgi:hypothetical protein